MRHLRQYRVFFLAIIILLAGSLSFGVAWAEDASSSNYKVTDTQFGAGAGSGCSTSYCANSAAGNLAVGNSSSANYKAQFGAYDAQGSSTPLLQVIENGGSNNLGILSPTATAKLSTQVDVRAYNISGYAIEMSGASPSQGEHNLNTPSTPTTSQTGTEQFGINLVANTTPSVGAAPIQSPDSTFSYGAPSSNYNTVNKFMYNVGDVVASSSTSTGETDYTISMIFNISNVTPGGQYTGSYNAVVVPVY